MDNTEDLESFWLKQKEKLGLTDAPLVKENPDAADAGTDFFYMATSPAWYKRKAFILSAAAVVLILVGLGLIFKSQNGSGTADKQAETVIIVHNGSQKQVTLPDGSKVWLNSGSELSYNKYFTQAPIKEITLKGEAFFDIKHDPNRTFIIHTRYMDIKDLGTRFNVKAYDDDDNMETSLINGSVEVYPKNHPEQMIRLKPNEKIVINTRALQNGAFKRVKTGGQKPLHLDSIQALIKASGGAGKPDAGTAAIYITTLKPQIKTQGDSALMETAWMQHQLAFSAESFNSLSRNLERWYDVQIKITNPEVGQYIFTGIFKEESLEQALSELQMIRPFQYEIRGRQVRIY
jgi:ferric-dicitrate binding protein FerR (iron transport regulator)